jgi:Lrp/AsnC family transcriptional regulator, leucine-responsive regulatory protein
MNKYSLHKVMDDLNRNILQQLQMNARLSTAEIGRRVSLSAPAVAERIEKMESAGIIKGYHTSLDCDKLDLTIRAFIQFTTTTLKRAELMTLIESIPEVIEWHTITGNYCIVMKVVAATSERLAQIIEQFEQSGETNTSLILMSGHKHVAIAD